MPNDGSPNGAVSLLFPHLDCEEKDFIESQGHNDGIRYSTASFLWSRFS